jgi:AraC-like DNA-binding protein
MSVTSTVVHHADTRFIEAAAVLRPYVGCFWIITAAAGAMIRVVPDGTTSISVQLRNGRPSGWSLRGPLLTPAALRFTLPTTMIGVRLRPGVAFLLSGVAAVTMAGRRIPLGGPAFRALADGGLAREPLDFVDLLQRFLVERLANARVHAVVAQALLHIERTHGSFRVADIAAQCGVSTRHLNRLMRTWVGYGPKRLGRIVRFQAALDQIDRAPAGSGAALASDNGYFDQAHLTLDMGRLAGATPGKLASEHAADFYKTRCDNVS